MFGILILIGLPLLEIAGFVVIGDKIGVGLTILWVIASAILGIYLFATQGATTWGRARSRVEKDEFPFLEMFDALCILFASPLLIIPGFFTDAVGLLLLLPPVRKLLFKALESNQESFIKQFNEQGGHFFYSRTDRENSTGRDTTIIDADFREVDETDSDNKNTDKDDRIPPPRG